MVDENDLSRPSPEAYVCDRCGQPLFQDHYYRCCGFRRCGPHGAVETAGVACKGVEPPPYVGETERLRAENAALIKALRLLLFDDPHDLTDTRPCETCSRAHEIVAKATGGKPHRLACHCHLCARRRRMSLEDRSAP